jgi:ABC-2 type transport system permease protein
MTAMFASSWTGMSYVEDMQTGVMDRFLTAPVHRGALMASLLAYQAVTTIVQSAIIIAIGWGIGARFPGGAAGIAALTGISVLIALAMAGLSNGFALLTRQREALIAASTTLVMPLTFLSGAFLSLQLIPGWIAGIARFNPVNWAASAGRLAVGGPAAWGTVAATPPSSPSPSRSLPRRPPGPSGPTSGRSRPRSAVTPGGGWGSRPGCPAMPCTSA